MYVYIKTERGTKRCNFKKGTRISELAIKYSNCWYRCNNRPIEDRSLDTYQGETIEFVPRCDSGSVLQVQNPLIKTQKPKPELSLNSQPFYVNNTTKGNLIRKTQHTIKNKEDPEMHIINNDERPEN